MGGTKRGRKQSNHTAADVAATKARKQKRKDGKKATPGTSIRQTVDLVDVEMEDLTHSS